MLDNKAIACCGFAAGIAVSRGDLLLFVVFTVLAICLSIPESKDRK